jgi:hypothetical protein
MRRWKAWLEWTYPKPISNILISRYLHTFYCKHKTDSLLFSIIQSHCKVNAAEHNELQQFCVSQWDNKVLHWDEALSHFVLHVHVWLDSHFVGLWICTNLHYLYHCSSWGLKEEFWIRVFQVSVVWPKYWGDFWNMILNVCALKWCKNYGNITFCLADTSIFLYIFTWQSLCR